MQSSIQHNTSAIKVVFFNREFQMDSMVTFRSVNHQIYTVVLNKTSLNKFDDKKHTLDNGIYTLAHGFRPWCFVMMLIIFVWYMSCNALIICFVYTQCVQDWKKKQIMKIKMVFGLFWREIMRGVFFCKQFDLQAICKWDLQNIDSEIYDSVAIGLRNHMGSHPSTWLGWSSWGAD